MNARTLKDEISAYNKLCEEGLELDHFGKWVIIYEGELNGVFDTEDEAILEAVKKIQRQRFLDPSSWGTRKSIQKWITHSFEYRSHC